MGQVIEAEIEQAKQIYRDKPKNADGRMSGSTSYLQRKMQWGYNHAAAIVEELEARGFLTAPDRNGTRFFSEDSKPVILCKCGKPLETPAMYAAHCKEFPDHFTKS